MQARPWDERVRMRGGRVPRAHVPIAPVVRDVVVAEDQLGANSRCLCFPPAGFETLLPPCKPSKSTNHRPTHLALKPQRSHSHHTNCTRLHPYLASFTIHPSDTRRAHQRAGPVNVHQFR